MKKLAELSFAEIQQMYAYALDLAATYHKDAELQYDKKEVDKGNTLKVLKQEWTNYARLFDQELQSRVKYALGDEQEQSGWV